MQPRSQGSFLPRNGRVGENPGNEVGLFHKREGKAERGTNISCVFACIQAVSLSIVSDTEYTSESQA